MAKKKAASKKVSKPKAATAKKGAAGLKAGPKSTTEAAAEAGKSRSGGLQAVTTESAQSSGGSTTTPQSASFKNFRHHPEMENFYRFVYENDLRFEALAIIDEIMAEKAARKRLKAQRRAQTH